MKLIWSTSPEAGSVAAGAPDVPVGALNWTWRLHVPAVATLLATMFMLGEAGKPEPLLKVAVHWRSLLYTSSIPDWVPNTNVYFPAELRVTDTIPLLLVVSRVGAPVEPKVTRPKMSVTCFSKLYLNCV